MEFILVSTTAPSRELAQRVAERLVADRLAACVHVAGPMGSVYRWQDRVEHAEEWACHAKTTRAAFDAVAAAIRAEHPYECPEIVATPLVTGSPQYLAWLDAQVKAAGE